MLLYYRATHWQLGAYGIQMPQPYHAVPIITDHLWLLFALLAFYFGLQGPRKNLPVGKLMKKTLVAVSFCIRQPTLSSLLLLRDTERIEKKTIVVVDMWSCIITLIALLPPDYPTCSRFPVYWRS